MKKTEKDIQLSFEFDDPDRKISFVEVKGKCKCGHSYEFKKADVVLEMTAPCTRCGTIIIIK